MQKILTAAQMRQVDRATIEDRGIPGLILMENAGGRVFDFLTERYGPLSQQRIAILCGKGNNGGDGLVLARRLVADGSATNLKVVLLASPESLTGDAAANWRMLLGAGFEPSLAPDSSAWQAVRDELSRSTLIVDAILGTGLQGPVRGFYAEVIADLNCSFGHCPVVAVDIPSGMPSDTGECSGEVVRTDATVTFTAPKVSQVFPPACHQTGELHVARIGTAAAIIEDDPELQLSLWEAADVRRFTAPRAPEAHKGAYGHVLVVAGSQSKPGAALMAGTAALRSGAGLVSVATAADAANAIVSHTPELMTLPAAVDEDGAMSTDSFDSAWLEGKSVVALGPGVGTSPLNQAFLVRLAREVRAPVVIDADGLTALAALGGQDWKVGSPVAVLTPHPGEMARLTGLSTQEIQSSRVEQARQLAQRRGVYVVLKGFRTLTAAPDGRVFVNPTGTPGMATGGAGDILTGMIAGLLAQFPTEAPEHTIAAAVYLHGLAGELAAAALGEQAMIATDLLDSLPDAVDTVRSSTNKA